METTLTQLRCVIVTPEKAVLDEPADFIVVPLYDGELGVLPGRAPLIGRLGAGELRSVHGNQTHRFFVDGGFVQVRDNVVTVLTGRAIAAKDIKLEAAQEALQTALRPTMDADEQQAHQKAQDRARAQIRIAVHQEQGAPLHAGH